MKAGSLGWVRTKCKTRAIVVLHLRDVQAVVITGTSTGGHWRPCVTIDDKENAGRVLRLSNPTHFYVTNIELVDVADIEYRGQGSFKIVHKIEQMLLDWLRDNPGITCGELVQLSEGRDQLTYT